MVRAFLQATLILTLTTASNCLRIKHSQSISSHAIVSHNDDPKIAWKKQCQGLPLWSYHQEVLLRIAELSPELLADWVLANMARLPKYEDINSGKQQEAAGQPGTLLVSFLQLDIQRRPEQKGPCQRQQLLRLPCFLPFQDQVH